MKKIILMVCFFIFCTGFCCFAGDGNVEVQILAKTGVSWNNTTLPLYRNIKPEITILKITIPPGVSIPVHRHPVINAGYLIKGELTVFCEDGKLYRLKEGDTIIEVVDTWHHGKNEGSVPAVIVVFYAGYEGEPITEYKK